MRTKHVIPIERIAKFADTAFERQIIYILKEHGCSRPWTQDSQFDTWYFCNVFRVQDKVTKWIIEHVIEPYKDDKHLFRNILIARRLSRISSMEALESVGGFEEGNEALVRGRAALKKMVALGVPVITNAFVMGIPDPSLGTNKIDYMYNLLDFYGDSVVRASESKSIERTTYSLMTAPNMGGFLSYEVSTDMTYSRYLQDATDINTWANPGPGCIRGANVLIYGNADCSQVTAKDALDVMRDLYASWEAYISDTIIEKMLECEERMKKAKGRSLTREEGVDILADMSRFKYISMREVEHWLCEFDKHERKRPNKRRY